MRAGFTLVEAMLASAIFGLMTLVLFEGVIVSTRIAHENSEILAAEAVAWDAVWKRFNENYDSLVPDTVEAPSWQSLDALNSQGENKAAPQLAGYDLAPKLIVHVEAQEDLLGWSSTTRKIYADVEWGSSASRKKLSDYGELPVVYRSELGRSY